MAGLAGIVAFEGEVDERAFSQIGQSLLHRGNKTSFVTPKPNMAVHLFQNEHTWHLESDQWKLFLSTPNAPYEQFLNDWCQDPIRALSNLSNSFALVAWDKSKQRYWLVRDSIGIQSLYWAKTHTHLFFSSELPSLTRLPSVNRELAVEHLAEYLSFRYVHAPRTLYKDIYAIPAGHIVIFDQHESREKRWHITPWRAVDSPRFSSKQAASEIDLIIRRQVEQAMFNHNEEIGVLLSGGLDSSAILHHASHLGKPPPSFTVTLKNSQADESPFAARVARLKGSQNHILRVNSDDFIEHLHIATRYFDQPLPTAAGAIQLQLFQFAKQHVDVLLTGDGGDEVFGGRSMPALARRIEQSKWVSKLPYLPQKTLQRIARKTGHRDLAASYTQFGQERFIGGSRVFVAPDRVALLTDPGLVRPNIRQTVLNPFYQEVDSDPINDILHVWQRGWLVEDSLKRSDQLSAHSSLQLLFPMLDKRLIEYCAQLPGTHKVRKKRLDFVSKWPLRLAMKDRLPKRLLARPKRTWLHPLDHWLRNDGRFFLHSQITEMCQRDRFLFVPARLQALYTEHVHQQANHGLQLWTLVLFHLWWKTIR